MYKLIIANSACNDVCDDMLPICVVAANRAAVPRICTSVPFYYSNSFMTTYTCAHAYMNADTLHKLL